MISCYKDRAWRILQQECHGGKEVIKGLPTQMALTFQLKLVN